MKKKAYLLLSMMLVLSMFLAACGGKDASKDSEKSSGDGKKEESTGEPQYGGDLVFGISGSPTNFNNLYYNDNVSSNIIDMMFIGLTSADLDFNQTTEGAAAESVEESEDALTYTVKIKEGIKFHDGEELNADDVVFTYNIPLSPDYDGVRAAYFKSLESVEKVDDYTVKFHMKEVDVQFPLIGLGFAILPEHILGDVPIADLGEHEFNTKNPIGAGPFKFVEWKDGEYVKVEAFEDYFDGRPYLDTITYKIVPDANTMLAQLQSGDINYFPQVDQPDVETVEAFADAANLRLENSMALSYTYLGYNMRNDLFKDKKVRQAITHAINREEIVENVMDGHGEVAHVPESPLSWAYNPDVPKFDFDREKAKELLAEAGWEPGADGILEKDGKKFSFEIKTNQGNKVREDVAVILQEQLKEVGIDAKPAIMEFSALIKDLNSVERNFEAVVMGWSLAIDPDPSGIFHTDEMEKGNNMQGYSNPDIDPLMEAQLKEKDREKRKEMIGEIQAQIAEDQPYTFLYYPDEYRAMPKNLRGYEFHPKNQIYHANKWWLEEEK
ncbi:peptide-binding protein [Bacillus chungangensis]|uniref:Peptide/nickel transport system substrate-binding protein n=1 Tax=Bacillus chungangensis TaxID=587633 RepID=A0ABT9WXE4_9BACI|nr:peptide-binding protein [Bacillus chungangensis]MDQ0177435.1 peptide/nickel transport system substrate-binding protein [Bacillus chungangensis]